LLGLGLLALATATLGWSSSAGRQDDGRPNILLISIDTLRSDHLGTYGYPRNTSPNLDRLARDGIVFETAYAPSNSTLPSHASMLTGLNPLAHGAMGPGGRLSDLHFTLAERLRHAGYHTAAWVGMGPFGWVGARRGFAQGFDLFEHRPHRQRYGTGIVARALDRLFQRYVLKGVGSARAQVGSVLRWLETSPREPFFAFVHFYDVHSKFFRLPYQAPEPFLGMFCEGELQNFSGCGEEDLCASRLLAAMANGRVSTPESADIRRMICLYDGGIAFLDSQLGRLLEAMDRRDLLARTVVVVTADHGEAFFEHQLPLHKTVYEAVARVPLVVRAPDGPRGVRVDGIVSIIDILPTLLELTGAPQTEPIEGSSLAARLGSHRAPAEELYDLLRDPAERENLFPTADPAVVSALRKELEQRWAASLAVRQQSLAAGDETLAVPEAEKKKLQALGYIQ
jgi:arylsulfatase A-like enzyme